MDALAAAKRDMNDASQSESTSENEMTFVIERLSFTQAVVSMQSDVFGKTQLDIPDMHLQDIGRKSHGATALEVAEQVFKPIWIAVNEAAIKQGLDIKGAKADIEDKVRKKFGSALQRLTNKLNRNPTK